MSYLALNRTKIKSFNVSEKFSSGMLKLKQKQNKKYANILKHTNIMKKQLHVQRILHRKKYYFWKLMSTSY